MKKSLLAFAAASMLLASPSFAQQNESPIAAPPEDQEARLDAASLLVERLNLRQLLNQLSLGTSRAIVGSLAASGEVNEETRNTVQASVRSQMAQRLPDLIPVLAPVTAQAFTLEELQAMNEFYASDVGRGIIGKLGGYQTASAQLMQAWMTQNGPAMQQAILDDLAAKGVEVPTAQQAQPNAQ